jgi:hypothetical protein
VNIVQPIRLQVAFEADVDLNGEGADQNPKAKAPAAKMPNPSIAKAVASYAGSMNIWGYLGVVRPTRGVGPAQQSNLRNTAPKYV